MSLTFADSLGNRLLKLVFMFRLKGAAGPHLASVTSAQVLQAHFVHPPVSSEMREFGRERVSGTEGGNLFQPECFLPRFSFGDNREQGDASSGGWMYHRSRCVKNRDTPSL